MNTTLSSIALISVCASACAAPDFALHNRDRVVFYGDSITDNSAYTTFVETFVVTRFPNLDVRFFNAGVGGDRVTGGWMGSIDQRLTRDLFSRRPSVVTVMLGMNDGSYRLFDQGIFDTYRNGYQHIVDQFKQRIPNARFFLIKPSPFDDVTRDPSFPGGYNSVLKQYGDYVAELAQKNSYGIVDFNTPLTSMLATAKETDAALSSKIIRDRVHPGSAGHLVMAGTLLKAWGAPGLVSSTDIDAKTGIVKTENANVTDVKTGGKLTWVSREGALPYPIDRKNPETKLVLQSCDFDQALNQELLKVTNLADGNYQLKIDGVLAGSFSSAALVNGVNLALYNTPMNNQASSVYTITANRTQTRYYLWRQLEFGLGPLPAKDVLPTIRAYEKAEDELIRLQHITARPRPHTFELSPI